MMDSNRVTLRILLVLTFIGSGLSMLSYLMFALMLPQLQQTVADNPGLLPEQFVTAAQRMFEVPQLYYGACAILYLISLSGAVLMWKERWSGFHSYTLAQLLLLAVPLLFLGRGFVGIGDVMMTALFVGAYYVLMKRVTATHDDEEANTQQEP
jgi:hypothetical protein